MLIFKRATKENVVIIVQLKASKNDRPILTKVSETVHVDIRQSLESNLTKRVWKCAKLYIKFTTDGKTSHLGWINSQIKRCRFPRELALKLKYTDIAPVFLCLLIFIGWILVIQLVYLFILYSKTGYSLIALKISRNCTISVGIKISTKIH